MRAASQDAALFYKVKVAAFLKKSGAKNFCPMSRDADTSTAQINKVFLLLFVHKK
jgi:hypothetical protein